MQNTKKQLAINFLIPLFKYDIILNFQRGFSYNTWNNTAQGKWIVWTLEVLRKKEIKELNSGINRLK